MGGNNSKGDLLKHQEFLENKILSSSKTKKQSKEIQFNEEYVDEIHKNSKKSKKEKTQLIVKYKKDLAKLHITLQSLFRLYSQKKRFLNEINSTKLLQAELKRHLAQHFYTNKKQLPFLQIQKTLISWSLKTQHQKYVLKTIQIQTVLRSKLQKDHYKKVKKSNIIIQTALRQMYLSKKFQNLRYSIILVQNNIRRYQERRKFFKNISRVINIQKQLKKHRLQKQLKREINKKRTINELYKTEFDYQEYLNKLEVYFIKCIREQGILSKEEINKTFVGLESIKFLSGYFVSELAVVKKKWNIGSNIGTILVKNVKFFQSYIPYVNNYQNCTNKITELMNKNKKFKRLIAINQKNKKLGKLDILSLSIMPVQRPSRIKLLVERIIKNTLPNHGDYSNLKRAYEEMENVCISINEKRREFEAIIKFQDLIQNLSSSNKKYKKLLLQPTRKLIKMYPMKSIQSSSKRYFFYLFNDILLIVGKTKLKKYKIKEKMNIGNILKLSYINQVKKNCPQYLFFKYNSCVYNNYDFINIDDIDDFFIRFNSASKEKLKNLVNKKKREILLSSYQKK
ncbi:faciogenital dysplasia protein [Anaeramoeba flamelloides]|uniref:Faciogenital dysplasia protein n=1 Tax=Anaeramoeba flamelloides TaxID=1746091 RepID=A0ABQ8YIM6_9EUKA|nr:faciogenital dysplasia protein [Anaeramoeba flamelloides]